MSTALIQNRRVVLATAWLGYAAVFTAFVAFEQSGLGLGHFFYLPVCLIALVTDARRGALGGVLAAALYALAVLVGPGSSATHVLTESTAIRLVTFTLVGAIVGWYASSNRALMARLRDHATHDFLTGLGNARVFDENLAGCCAAGRPFTLVLADMDDLKRINDTHGHEAGNAALRAVADALQETTDAGDEVARIGGDEFAIITGLTPEETALLCARISRAIARKDLGLCFGITAYPADGTASVELFRKADDRLFTAKLLRANRRTVKLAAGSSRF